jgi:hypothetical protein
LGGTVKIQSCQSAVALLAISGLLVTIISGVSMAQPWGDNYAYQNVSGYLGLFLFLAWAVSPYAYLYWMSGRLNASGPVKLARLIVTAIVCVGGIYIVVDSAFIHLDAQGGLIFIFLPIYQWILVGLFEFTGYIVARRSAT